MRNLRSWVYLISFLAISASVLGAQTSTIEGMVKVEQQPLSSASVSAYCLDRQETKTVGQWATMTGADGSFTLRSLPYGTYIVRIRFEGSTIYQAKLVLNSQTGQQLKVDLKKK